MDKLFNYLLNRSPTLVEREKFSKNTFQEINKFILGMDEYRNLVEQSNQELSKIIKNNLGNIKIHKKLKLLMSDIYKRNSYNPKSIVKYIDSKKLEIKKIVDTYLRQYFVIDNSINYMELYQVFFKNNFDYRRIEFQIVSSNVFLNLTEKKLNEFYKKV